MRSLLLTIIMIMGSFQTFSQDHKNTKVVLELFTSQGCSSCPRADDLLKDVRDNDLANEVIALSYHVDYWNYIGWKDPFSKAAYSNKQREYASKFYNSTIYTPQIVVNGEEHFVGSDAGLMRSKIKHYLKSPNANRISIEEVAQNNGIVNFDYSVSGTLEGKQLIALLVIKDRETKVTRGENRSRTLRNANIVVSEAVVTLNKEGSASLVIPDLVNLDDELSLVLLAKDKRLSITGAQEVSL